MGYIIVIVTMILSLSNGCSSMSNNKNISSTYRLSDFKETPISNLSKKDLQELNYSSDNEFEVVEQGGKLLINKAPRRYFSELEIDGGKLIGIDRGEWGGELLFRPKPPAKEDKKIKGGNLVSIFRFKDDIYFAEGLAHLSISEGALYRMNIQNNEFSYEKLFDFEDAPEAIAVFHDKILIASHRNFYVVDNEKKELLFENTFWNNLYPTSIACIDEQNIYIGMRGGITKINMENKTMSFYRF